MIIGYLVLCALVSIEGIWRRIGFWKGFFWTVLTTPFIGLFIIMNSGRLDARGCTHCGNKYNEADYCGLCGKNEAGAFKPDKL